MKEACVAELLKDKEALRSKEARDTANDEWQKLEARYCWDIKNVVRWRDVKKKANKENE